MVLRKGRKVTIILVVAAIVAGLSFFGYLSFSGHKPEISIVTNNTVINETIEGNFENFSTGPSYIHVFYYNATTSFFYGNHASNLTLKIELDPYNNAEYHYIELDPKIWAFGNIAFGLHPRQFMLNMSDLGIYSNGDVKGLAGYVDYVYPYNVTDSTSAPANGAITFGNFSFLPQFNLINQTQKSSYYEFGVNWNTEINFFTPSSDNIGTHILHFTVSLEGLGRPVSAQINVLLVDKT